MAFESLSARRRDNKSEASTIPLESEKSERKIILYSIDRASLLSPPRARSATILKEQRSGSISVFLDYIAIYTGFGVPIYAHEWMEVRGRSCFFCVSNGLYFRIMHSRPTWIMSIIEHKSSSSRTAWGSQRPYLGPIVKFQVVRLPEAPVELMLS